jgi:hypothetical protein
MKQALRAGGHLPGLVRAPLAIKSPECPGNLGNSYFDRKELAKNFRTIHSTPHVDQRLTGSFHFERVGGILFLTPAVVWHRFWSRTFGAGS